MANKKITPLQQRRILEDQRSEFKIEKSIQVTPNVSIIVEMTEQVATDAINIRDALTVARNLQNVDSINALHPEVRKIIEGLQSKEFLIEKNEEIPEWLKSGLSANQFDIIFEAKNRVITHYSAQFKLAFAEGLLVSLLKNARLVIDGEETTERFFIFRKGNDITIVTINPIFDACSISNDYFNDLEKNKELEANNQPILPFRNPREVAEQEVAWADSFQNAYPVAAILLNGIFEEAIDKLAYYTYGGQNSVDKDGFRPSNVGNNMENAPSTDSKTE